MRVSANDLSAFCIQAMRNCGMNEKDAALTADVLVTNDLFGVFTHGTRCLRGYLRRMKAGGLNPKGTPTVVRQGPAWAVVDGQSSMAMVTSCMAMDVAIEKARTCGIGYVGVTNSCHFAAAGYYALQAAKQNMIGLSMANDMKSMVVPGARVPVFGTDPFAVAIPAGNEKPIFLDIAMSTVAGSKVYQAVKEGRSIPNTWIVDNDGVPTTDGSLYPHAASMLPMSGHKGYGLALMIETLAGLVSGGGIRNEVLSWMFEDPTKPTNHSHAFIAINIGAISPLSIFKDRADDMIHDIRSTPKAKGSDRIYLPGEIEWERHEKATKEGIDLPFDSESHLRDMAGDLGMKFPFGA